MEHYAFTRIASKTPLIIDWHQKANGEADVFLNLQSITDKQTADKVNSS